jgi:hypothetical protein
MGAQSLDGFPDRRPADTEFRCQVLSRSQPPVGEQDEQRGVN